MACQVVFENGEITKVYSPNGQESNLYNQILSHYEGNKEKALEKWVQLTSQKDSLRLEQLDSNGEPIVTDDLYLAEDISPIINFYKNEGDKSYSDSKAVFNRVLSRLKAEYPLLANRIRGRKVMSGGGYVYKFGLDNPNLMYQLNTPIKEGVEELFKSNPELAEAVYKALGFKSFDTKGVSLDIKERDGWKWIKLNGKNIGEVRLVKNDRRSKEVGLSIKLNEEYQNKGYGQIVHILVADWAKNEFGDTLYSDFYNSQAEINTLLALTKKGYAEQIGDYGTQEDGRYYTDVRAFRIKTSDEIGTIDPQQKQQAKQLYQQYLESLNKPNTNPILQNNQQEQVKKFAELQERLNNKEFLEGAKSVYEATPKLQQFGTQEEYNDYIARVSLGIIKNPSSGDYNYTSQVKDIVYHFSNTKIDKPNKEKFSLSANINRRKS
jgi:hypothetical protein